MEYRGGGGGVGGVLQREMGIKGCRRRVMTNGKYQRMHIAYIWDHTKGTGGNV